MKRNNILSNITIIIGLLITLIGAYFSIDYLIQANSIIEYKDNSSLKDNRLIYLKGNLEIVEKAYEVDLEFYGDTCLLIREVKTVQSLSDKDGQRLVLANYNIENPSKQLDSTIKPNYFIGKANIKGIELDDSVLRYLANGTDYKEYTSLDPDSGNPLNLTLVDNAYVTASDEWNLNDIKLTYKYLSEDDEIEILGKYKNGILTVEGDYMFASNSTIGLANIQSSIRTMSYPYIIIFSLGMIIVVSSLILKKKGNL